MYCGDYNIFMDGHSGGGFIGSSIKDCVILNLGALMEWEDPFPESIGIYADDVNALTIDSNTIWGCTTAIEAHGCPGMSIQNNNIMSIGTSIYVDGFFSIFTRIADNFLVGNFLSEEIDQSDPWNSTVVLDGTFCEVLGNYIVGGYSYSSIYAVGSAGNIANNVLWGLYSKVGMYLEEISGGSVNGNIIMPMSGGEPDEDTASIKLVYGMGTQLANNMCAYGGIVAETMFIGRIKDNICVGNEEGVGIDLDSCFDLIISGNNCERNKYGLRMRSTLEYIDEENVAHSQCNTISGNTFCNNLVAEIMLEACDDNNINGNICKTMPLMYDDYEAEYSILLAGTDNKGNLVTGNRCTHAPVDEGGAGNIIAFNMVNNAGGGEPE